MKVVGIIAEYNPFHNGHKYHLQKARETSDADIVIVLMSQCFTQRGDAAICLPSVRAKMALDNGADAVFAFPVYGSCRDAENFALWGVSILDKLGVDCISFGVEKNNIEVLWKCAKALENESAQQKNDLHNALSSGTAYPAAVSSSIEKQIPDSCNFLKNPNNILGICYLRALLRINSKMDVCPVKRESCHAASSLKCLLPSSSAVRNAVYAGDYAGIKTAIPDDCVNLLMNEIENGRIVTPDSFNAQLTYRLRTMTEQEYANLPDVSEGIEKKLRKSGLNYSTRNDIIMATKSKRYTYSRISRLCTHALLQISASDILKVSEEIPRLIGFRDSALPFLRQLKKKGICIPFSAEEMRHSKILEADMRAYDVWSCGCRIGAGAGFREKIVHTT